MQKRSRRGFTLIEVMIAVVIIGLLASLAVPTFLSIRKRTQHFRFMNDVRIYRDALETYYVEVGTLPVDSATGVVDGAMQDYIRPSQFAQKTPIGGQWDIEANDSGITLGVGAVGYTIDATELAELDGRFDDGILATGRLRDIVSGSRFYYVVE